jgi:hypothetical protein
VYDTIIAACRIAVDGINGPVVVDIPEDLQAEMVTVPNPPPSPPGSGCSTPQQSLHPSAPVVTGRVFSTTLSCAKITMPLHSPFVGVLAPRDLGLRSHVECPVRQSLLKEVLGYVNSARRPLLLLGGGCVKCEEEVLNELVEVLGMPVVYTFMGKVRGGENWENRGAGKKGEQEEDSLRVTLSALITHGNDKSMLSKQYCRPGSCNAAQVFMNL